MIGPPINIADCLNPLSDKVALHRAQYSAWLDQHTRDETLANVKAALDASPAAAREQAAAVLPLMLRLCQP